MKNSKTMLKLLYAIGITSLILGMMIYLLFRESTYVSEFVSFFVPLNLFYNPFSFAECEFLKFWFVDFLWALSFSAWLHVALLPGFKGAVFCFITVSFTGIAFEFLQKIDVISGTADVWDVIAYISASVLMSIIYLFLRRKTYEKI